MKPEKEKMRKITAAMRDGAAQLLRRTDISGYDRKVFENMVSGKRKKVDWSWWEKFFVKINEVKRARIAAMADPAHNDNPHEVKVAESFLEKFKDKAAPGMPPAGSPLPTSLSDWMIKPRKKKK